MKTYVRRLIARERDLARDNAIRAAAAFRGKALDEEHGESGKTRRQLLAEYQSAEEEAMLAERWLDSL